MNMGLRQWAVVGVWTHGPSLANHCLVWRLHGRLLCTRWHLCHRSMPARRPRVPFRPPAPVLAPHVRCGVPG